MTRRTAVLSVIAGLFLALLTAGAIYNAAGDDTVAPEQDASPPSAGDPLAEAIAAAQTRLEDLPGDYVTWAELGAAYVEQARVTADPSYYAQAEGALAESLRLRPDGNDVALTGMGALANARHDFAGAAVHAQAALAINAYSSVTYGVLTDALTQLGDYPGATAAVNRMQELRPGIASFTRLSYDFELHGDLVNAQFTLEQALDLAQSRAEESFCRLYLSQLEFNSGDLDAAETYAADGLQELPDDPGLRQAQARVDAARGNEDEAVAGYQAVVNARPLPENLLEFGNYLTSVGRDDEAADQYALVETVRSLFAANGVTDDLGTALYAADIGDAATAVPAAEAEWALRRNVDSADAMAWALHAAGRDAEALPFAEQATGIGGVNASFVYHRGVIEAALGLTDRARASLQLALDTNPYFSSTQAPLAEQALSALG